MALPPKPDYKRELTHHAANALQTERTREAERKGPFSDRNVQIETPRQMQIVRTTCGRNQPCSCGSGKKYKKCCGATL